MPHRLLRSRGVSLRLSGQVFRSVNHEGAYQRTDRSVEGVGAAGGWPRRRLPQRGGRGPAHVPSRPQKAPRSATRPTAAESAIAPVQSLVIVIVVVASPPRASPAAASTTASDIRRPQPPPSRRRRSPTLRQGNDGTWRRSPPDLSGGLDDQTEFGHLFLVAERVALNGRGEATLGRQTELLDGDVAAGLLDAALELVLVLELAALGGDQAEHDQLPLGDEPQRLESARPLVVVLQEEAVDREAAEQRLGDEVVAALGGPGGAEVAPAHVGGDRHAVGLAGQRLVDLADVALMQVLGVVAAAGDLGPLLGVV